MVYPVIYKSLEEVMNAYEREYEKRLIDQKLYYLNEAFIQFFPENAKQIIKSRIKEKRDSKLGTLSKGMKKKIAISRALIHDPGILIFDEPTVGLDPITTHFIRKFMKDLSNEGKTVLMSTHNLHEAEILCDRVMILDKGKKVAYGTINELKRKFGVKEEGSDLEDIFLKAVDENE